MNEDEAQKILDLAAAVKDSFKSVLVGVSYAVAIVFALVWLFVPMFFLTPTRDNIDLHLTIILVWCAVWCAIYVWIGMSIDRYRVLRRSRQRSSDPLKVSRFKSS